MEAHLTPLSSRLGKLDWQSLAPACSWQGCRRSRNRLQAMLHRREGIRSGSDWLCSAECLEQFVLPPLSALLLDRPAIGVKNEHRIPLGLILLSRGHVDGANLQRALQLQKSGGGRIGDCLRQICEVSEGEITSALASQWSCPVYPIGKGSECRHLLPSRLQEFHRMLPVHFVEASRDLYIAFEQRIDYAVLFAVEQMLNCHTKACVLPEAELRRRLSLDPVHAGKKELEFDSVNHARELAQSISSYVQQTGARQVRFVGCGAYVWVRMDSDHGTFDLLVRRWK